jgi:pyridoxine/pyridoxamine 5'-phosphate oxidase
MIYHPEDITGLPFVEELCWKLLSEAVSDRKSAMHQVVVSTAVGDIAHMRTVVLRRADIKEKSLYFHTDIRSSKVDDLKQNGMLSWLTYDQSLRTQIRLSGPTIIHHNDEICKEHWSKTGHHSRRYYMLDTDSNKVLSDRSTGLSPLLTAFDYTLEDSEVGFEYFAVVETKVTWMEWYFTHNTGNLRASFDYDASSLIESRWLAP